MNTTDKDGFESRDKHSQQQSTTGSEGKQGFPQSGSEGDSIGSSLGEGKSKQLPSHEEDARRQDERDHSEYGNTGYPDSNSEKRGSHSGNDLSGEARTKASENEGPTGDLHKNR